MPSTTSPDARAVLIDALLAWEVEGDLDPQEMVDEATSALVAGLESPALVELASLYPDPGWDVVDRLVGEAAAELGIELRADLRGVAALRRQARRLLRGEIGPADLAHAAHDQILRATPGRRLPSAAHILDEAGYTYETLHDDVASPDGDPRLLAREHADLDEQIRAAARALLAS